MRYTTIIGDMTLAFGTFTNTKQAKNAAAEVFPDQPIRVLMLIDAPIDGGFPAAAKENLIHHQCNYPFELVEERATEKGSEEPTRLPATEVEVAMD